MRIVSIGEILWDVFENEEHLGGASFNFAAHARRLGHEVLFVSAVGDDERGRRALARMEELELSTRFVPRVVGEPTGTVTVRVDAAGQPEFRIHRPAAYDRVTLDETALEQLAEFRPDWIYYGTLHQMDAHARWSTRRLMDSNPTARRFYDVNLRQDSYTPALVRRLMEAASVVKLNESEVQVAAPMLGIGDRTLEGFCRSGAKAFGWQAACVTRGALGCGVLLDGEYVEAAGYRVPVADAVGAGDAFAAAFLHALDDGWTAEEAADFANRVGALVASRPGAIPEWTMSECRLLRG